MAPDVTPVARAPGSTRTDGDAVRAPSRAAAAASRPAAISRTTAARASGRHPISASAASTARRPPRSWPLVDAERRRHDAVWHRVSMRTSESNTATSASVATKKSAPTMGAARRNTPIAGLSREAPARGTPIARRTRGRASPRFAWTRRTPPRASSPTIDPPPAPRARCEAGSKAETRFLAVPGAECLESSKKLSYVVREPSNEARIRRWRARGGSGGVPAKAARGRPHLRYRWRQSLGYRRRPWRGTAGGRPGFRNRDVRLDREPPPRTSRTPPPPRTRARSSSRPSRTPPRRITS